MGKHNPDDIIGIVGLSVSYSTPIYTGSGNARVGSTTVTLTFQLSDGSTLDITEPFNDINVTTSRFFSYTIALYVVTVRATVTVVGQNNQMNITGAAAEIISKTAI